MSNSVNECNFGADEQTEPTEDWFSRLQDERLELLDKIAKLSMYEYKDELMVVQLHTMIAYCSILDIRIMNEKENR